MCCTCKVLKLFIGCGYGWCGVCEIVVGKIPKDIGMGVHKGNVVLFVPSLFGCFLGISSLYVFSFLPARPAGTLSSKPRCTGS